MWEEIFNIILGMVNTRQGTTVTLDSLSIAPTVNRGSYEDMLAEVATFTPSHLPRHVKFVDTVQGGPTSSPCHL